MFGLTNEGFKLKRLADIRLEIRNQLNVAFGGTFDTTGGSVSGVLIGLYAQMIAVCWSQLQMVSDSNNPATADGVSLLDLGARRGLFPKAASPLITSDILLNQTSGMLITLTAGTLLDIVYDGVTITLELVSDVAVPSGVEARGVWMALDDGYQIIPASFVTGDVGGCTVSAVSDLIGGGDAETEDAFRMRVMDTWGLAGAGTDDAIRAQLYALPYIQQAIVISNRTMSVAPNGQPPKSFRAIVLPNGYNALTSSQSMNIVNVIASVHTSGIESWGQQGGLYVNDSGVEEAIKYDLAGIVDVLVRVYVEGPYDADRLKNKIIANGGLPAIGQNARVSALTCGLVGLDGITDLDMQLSTDGVTWRKTIIMNVDEVYRLTPANITIIEGIP